MNTSAGAFELGDRVTLLFGKNKEVVDVVSMSSTTPLDIVIVINSYKEISTDRENEGASIRYVDVMYPDGSVSTYETNSDYSDFVGEVVKIEYAGNTVTLTEIATNSIWGKFEKNTPSLNGHWLSGNCQILELTSVSKSGATVRKISLSDIETNTLNSDQVIHAQTSGVMEDITFLYLKDVTKIDSTFGIVTQVPYVNEEKNIRREHYTILVGAQEMNVKLPTSALKKASAVEIIQTTSGQEYRLLHVVGIGGKIDGYVEGRIRIDGEIYLVSDYVKVYGVNSKGEYESMSVSQIVGNDKIERITLFSDKFLENGGVVRVIVVSLNN